MSRTRRESHVIVFSRAKGRDKFRRMVRRGLIPADSELGRHAWPDFSWPPVPVKGRRR